MHETVQQLGNPEFYVTALVARWRAPTATLTWINCGHPSAYLVGTTGELEELKGNEHAPLGTGPTDPSYQTNERQLHQGERLILLTDGMTDRKMENGGRFGIEGLKHALERATPPPHPLRWPSKRALPTAGANPSRTTAPSS